MVVGPLRWAWVLGLGLFWVSSGSCGVVSDDCGGATSIQLDGAMVTKTSSSQKEMSGSMTCWSSHMLSTREQG